MKYLVVLVILGMLCSSALARRFHLDGNVTVSDPDGTLNYRRTWMFHNALFKVAGFKSLALNLDDDSLEIDTLAGFVSYQNVPLALLAYLNIDHEWDGQHADLNASQNLMAKAFYQLSEVDQNGNDVAVYSLGDDDSVNWAVSYNFTGDLKYFTLEATMDLQNGASQDPFYIEITFFLSQVKGMIDLANTTITPRVLESTVRISNYTYANSNNNLRLKVIAAHGDLKAVGTKKIQAGSGLEGLYISLSGECQVVDNRHDLSGDVRSVAVSAWTKATNLKRIINRTHAKQYLDIKYSSNWDIHIASVDFPAGVSNLIYDPTLGAGSIKAANTSASSLLLPSLFLIFSALLGTLLF